MIIFMSHLTPFNVSNTIWRWLGHYAKLAGAKNQTRKAQAELPHPVYACILRITLRFRSNIMFPSIDINEPT